jgi:hypothetical protein
LTSSISALISFSAPSWILYIGCGDLIGMEGDIMPALLPGQGISAGVIDCATQSGVEIRQDFGNVGGQTCPRRIAFRAGIARRGEDFQIIHFDQHGALPISFYGFIVNASI